MKDIQYNYLQNISRMSMFRAKALRWAVNRKGLHSKRRIRSLAYIFHVVVYPYIGTDRSYDIGTIRV